MIERDIGNSDFPGDLALQALNVQRTNARILDEIYTRLKNQ